MVRPLRIEYPGAIYHAMSRGNAQQAIFRDDIDRQKPMPLGRIEARLLCGMHEVTTWKKKKLVWQSFFFPSSVKTSNGKPRFCLKR